jgi:hypothetical protein
LALTLSRLLLAAVVLVLAAGCAADEGSPAASAPSSWGSATPAASAWPTPAAVRTQAANPKLRKELLAMLAADQADRSDPEAGVAGDQERSERLGEIVAQHGWPTRTLVGDDGATAAWAIAQHSDLDPDFQRRMLGLMREAAAAGEADLGELAYLTDRVAANAGQPQTYGTQMGCGADGKPQLAPLAEPDRVDELRAEAGLPTLEEYLAELAEVCAQSQ